MLCYFAPMEGITGCRYRRTHCACFPGADKYFMPFVSPRQDHTFTRRELAGLLPEHNRGVPVVPQLLTRNPEDFLWAAGELAAMGYREVNLNLGCPSGTVVAKGKGAGLLGRPQELERFLDRVFAAAPVAVSVKTRLGLTEPEEFGPLLELYRRYPMAELIIHPRVRKEFYKGRPRLEAFAPAVEACPFPVCYNGDLVTTGDVAALAARFPGVRAVMAGRGAAADPALFRKLKGGPAAERAELQSFHDRLYEGCCRDFDGRRSAMLRMKELWSYHMGLFRGGERLAKALRKARDPAEYEAVTAEIFRTLPLETDAVEIWRGGEGAGAAAGTAGRWMPEQKPGS